jgi:hypothetical protein
MKTKDSYELALQKGKEFKRNYITDECYGFGPVMYLLNKSKMEVLTLVFNKELICLNYTGLKTQINQLAFPSIQFNLQEKTYAQGLNKLSERFVSPWDLVFFLDSGDYYLSGRKPIDVLKEGDLESVLISAENYGEQRAL